MSIARYGLNSQGVFVSMTDGGYVSYQDYAKLAAENAGLKGAHPQPFGPEMMKALDAYEKHQDETPETGMLDAFFILRDSIRVNTAETDAFLAEVLAKGVEMFAASQKVAGGGEHPYSAVANEFAAQLRKGAQS